MDEKITIDDIAEALGVSKTTVSRAVSGKGRISEVTRARVLDYIEKHSYTPNPLARGLAENKTYNIAVVWPEDYEAVDLPFFQRCIMGVNRVVAEQGYDIIISMINDDNLTNLKRVVEHKKVDGVILTRTLVNDKPADYLKSSGMPFVAIGSSDDDSIVQVDNNNLEACRELTSILISKGSKKIAIIGGNSNHVITRTRLRGYTEAFKNDNINYDPELVFLDSDDSIKITGIIEELVAKKVDTVICMDDAIVGQVLTSCRRKHIRIPEDIKVASFYNSTILDNMMPSVTSLNFDDTNLGAVAAKALMNIIDGKNVRKRIESSYEIVLKDSTK
ncbi:LacI family DNA-binding transcriptional regulator [Eubacterium sp.]|uniref:LacI family DNA-binding transcriptional regulator n=1 Tax=Eubacterium sp. TaxID=142586 RepID=UPI002585579B|nr:LacI family DNA-binding transcriptional regulator [Eubacterium sp.]MCR5369001.1 LacI family transcriptional regulator [Eubacterium sp.]